MKVDLSKIEDNALVRHCLKDDRRYQEVFYRRFADDMFSVCLSYAENEDEAADILQDGFIKAFRKLDTFNFSGSIKSWLRKIIVNTAIEYYRRKRRKEEFISEYKKIIPGSVNLILDSINSADLIRLVNKLPAKAGMVLKLYAIEGYEHREIADLMHISVGTSKSQLNRARRLLKERLSSVYG